MAENVMEAPPQRIEIQSDNFNSDDFGSDNSDSSDAGADGAAPGMGQSKSSRRRRRKRKGKGSDGASAGESEGSGSAGSEGGASGAAPVVMEGESLSLAAAATPAPRRQSQGGGQPQAGGQPQGQPGQGQGGKRWKKKFRDRERRPGGGAGRSENPGNDFRPESPSGGGGQQGGGGYQNNGGGNGFKRKGKQVSNNGSHRKERSFVGPMDHSYREVNGNSADASMSTVQMNGFRKGQRHHGDSQPIDHSMPRAVPIPENAQTHIYFFIEDLFFTAKIQETARKQGVKVAFVKNEKDALAELTDGDDRDKPALIVFDLNNANAKPLTLIPKLKTKLKKSASIIGFLSHLQGDLKAKAVEAGCDTVMPRAAFSQNLPNLLRRYSVEEGEEINYNQ